MNGDRPLPERVPVLTEVIEVADGEPVGAPAGTSWGQPVAPAPDVPDVPDLSDLSVLSDLRDPHELPDVGDAARDAGLSAPDPAQSRALPAAELPDPAVVVNAVLRRIDLQLDARLREALAPALARAADTLIREAREDLAATVREAVEEALARELGRRRED